MSSPPPLSGLFLKPGIPVGKEPGITIAFPDQSVYPAAFEKARFEEARLSLPGYVAPRPVSSPAPASPVGFLGNIPGGDPVRPSKIYVQIPSLSGQRSVSLSETFRPDKLPHCPAARQAPRYPQPPYIIHILIPLVPVRGSIKIAAARSKPRRR